jgi:hypothetical protein
VGGSIGRLVVTSIIILLWLVVRAIRYYTDTIVASMIRRIILSMITRPTSQASIMSLLPPAASQPVCVCCAASSYAAWYVACVAIISLLATNGYAHFYNAACPANESSRTLIFTILLNYLFLPVVAD